MSTTTLGYVRVWSKGAYKDVEWTEGIIFSGRISVPLDKIDELISYLDSAERDEYGIKMDIAVFGDSADSTKLTGKLTTPYNPEEKQAKAAAAPQRKRLA